MGGVPVAEPALASDMPTVDSTPGATGTMDPVQTEPVVADLEPPPPPPPPVAQVPADCDDLVGLEAPAMLGQLGPARRKCLEARVGTEKQQTTRKRVSVVLINDAQARGDKIEWERLVKRHLESIDRSDPNLCMSYAIHLNKGGVGRSNSVIKWADYSLENKQQWSGNTYKKRVNGLLKLKAVAANRLWESAEGKYVAERTDENEQKSMKYRGMTKDFSREWLDYARASGQDTKGPLAMCVSAAGNKEFCEE
jgi:hypothetical protein